MIIILSGPVHAGKTTFLERAAARLREKGAPLGGYLTPSLRGPGNRAAGYELVSLADGGRCSFLARDSPSPGPRAGPFFLDPSGLRRAKELIRAAPDRGLLVVDEVGPLELEGGGVRRALDKALSGRTGPALLVVRESILGEALESLDIAAARVVDVRQPGAEETILGWLEGELC